MAVKVLQWSLVLTAICWFLLWPSKKTTTKLPPGPKGLPVIGHVHVLAGLAHCSLQQLSRRYGPLMFLKLGTIPVIVVSSPEMAKEVLKNQDTVFASRPTSAVARYVFHNKDLIFAPFGERFKKIRRLCTTQLFSGSRIRHFTSIIREELFDLCCRLLEVSQTSQVVDVRRYLLEYNFNIFARIVIRKHYFGPKTRKTEGEEAHEFLEMLDQLGESFSMPVISDFSKPGVAGLEHSSPQDDGPKNRHVFAEVIDTHQESEGDPDFVSIMQLFFGHQDAKSVKAMLQDVLGAGIESSVTTIEWAIAELLHNPDVTQRVQKEIESVVGLERMVEESDIPKLEYLDAVIKEVFRMHPPGTLLIPHSSTRATKISGYDIPEKSTVFVNVYAIGRDPDAWKDPDTFNPDRFIGSAINVYGQDFELLPFGSGRRICLGLKNVQLTLSNLLHGFKWNFQKPMMEEKLGAVTTLLHSPRGQVTSRLSEHVYKTFAAG